jgi:hypothetical protein
MMKILTRVYPHPKKKKSKKKKAQGKKKKKKKLTSGLRKFIDHFHPTPSSSSASDQVLNPTPDPHMR